jgi:hypothetical protein
MTWVKLRGFRAIDRRTVVAREALAFRSELVAALGGEADLSPQRRRLVDMTARAALLLDHVDGWLVGQRSLVNPRATALLPVLVQRQALADHLARLPGEGRPRTSPQEDSKPGRIPEGAVRE